LRSAPKAANSNTSVSNRGTNRNGRKPAPALLARSLNHVPGASVKLRKWYDRLCEYRKPELVRTGLRRHLQRRRPPNRQPLRVVAEAGSTEALALFSSAVTVTPGIFPAGTITLNAGLTIPAGGKRS